MKNLIIGIFLISSNVYARTITCSSEFYPQAVALTIQENQSGKAEVVTQVETIKDMSGPKDIITKKETGLFGGKNSVGKDRKPFYFNLTSKDFSTDSFKEVREKLKPLPQFEKGVLTVITNFGNTTGKNAGDAAKKEFQMGSSSISYLSLLDKTGNRVVSIAFLGWSGYFNNCK